MHTSVEYCACNYRTCECMGIYVNMFGCAWNNGDDSHCIRTQTYNNMTKCSIYRDYRCKGYRMLYDTTSQPTPHTRVRHQQRRHQHFHLTRCPSFPQLCMPSLNETSASNNLHCLLQHPTSFTLESLRVHFRQATK